MRHPHSQTLRSAGGSVISAVGLIALLATAVLPAHSQTRGPTAAPEPGLEEITVTAQRFSENLQSTPVAVTAFTARTLEDRQIDNVRDAANQIPGIMIQTTTGVQNAARIFLRGVGQDNAGLLFDPAVGVYIDNVYYPRIMGAFFDFYDIERLEVLRGPQGTLYGRNTSAGAIKIISKRPSYDFDFQGDFTYGSFNRLDGRVYVTGPLIDDKLAASFSGLWRYRDGISESLNYGRDVNDRDYQAARAKLLFTPSDDFEAELSVDAEKDRSDPFVPTLITNYKGSAAGAQVINSAVNSNPITSLLAPTRDLYTTELRGLFYSKLDSRAITVNARYNLDDGLAINSITGYRELLNNLLTPLALLSGSVTSPASVVASTSYSVQDTNFSQEVNATINRGPLKGVAGLYYFREYGTDDQFAGLCSTGLPCTAGVGAGSGSYAALVSATPSFRRRLTQSGAAYGQGSYEIVPDLSLVLGARYTYEREDFTQWYYATNVNPAALPVLLAPKQTAGKNFYAFTPKAGLDWQIDQDVLAYFSYTKGFKSGGFNPVNPTTAGAVVRNAAGQVVRLAGPNDVTYAPEKVDSYEIGLKFETDDHRLRVNSAIFYAQYATLQLPVFFPGTVNSYTSNTSGADVAGLEMEASYQVTDALQLYGDLTRQRGRYVAPFTCTDLYNNVINCQNRNLKGLIPTKTVLGFTYATEIPGLPGTFRFGADWDHVAAFYNNVSNTGQYEASPAHDDLNAFLSYQTEDKHWTFTAEGKNITNNEYCGSVLQVGASGVSGQVVPAAVCYPNDPATWAIRVKYQFGGAERTTEATAASYTPPPQPKAVAPAARYLVFFDFDKSAITPEASRIIANAAGVVKGGQAAQVSVTGHTDLSGSDAYNLALSKRRAQAVADQLIADGVPAGEIVLSYKGKREPLVPTADGVREPQNRRAEIVLQ